VCVCVCVCVHVCGCLCVAVCVDRHVGGIKANNQNIKNNTDYILKAQPISLDKTRKKINENNT
jgi:hypothetical protein